MQPVIALEQDIRAYAITLDPDRWRSLCKEFVECAFPQGDVILSQTRVANHWLFVTDGIVASEQTRIDGDALIARFFERGQLCSNLTSAWGRQLASDDLVAITYVEGVLIPNSLFREQYLRGDRFGEYLRMKAMETLMFDKDVVCVKTSNETQEQYQFLEHRYTEVVKRAKQKDLARFIGITPQGLNRFLKNRSQ